MNPKGAWRMRWEIPSKQRVWQRLDWMINSVLAQKQRHHASFDRKMGNSNLRVVFRRSGEFYSGKAAISETPLGR
ncbi:hypothetical protein ACFPIF_08715 [Brevundimonas faecalis]|uniref:hypothetical protein n=1 Tax=Brevundimonas faecalis TaxID=947378 RepID=UPI003608EAB7